MQPLTSDDLTFINDLYSRSYTGLTIATNSTDEEREHLKSVKKKLKDLANHFAKMYSEVYGPFKTNVSPEANPVTRGNTLHNVWSTFFKGAANKQYAAQISFVIDRDSPCLNVGFYFGRASTHKLNETERKQKEAVLENLGKSLSTVLKSNPPFRTKYNELFDIGFTPITQGVSVLPDHWVEAITTDTKDSQIIARIEPNDAGDIELSRISFCVSQVIFLMAAINTPAGTMIMPPPLTPEQYAKKAERNAQIGLNGELYILEQESRKLQMAGMDPNDCLKHVALESSRYGYDILSRDEQGNDLFIEVKTTTRKKEDPYSRKFFLSSNEYKTYENNSSKYKLYRVYDIENDPSFEIIDLKETTRESDGYVISY